jgi:NHL repeat-containing protein
LNNNQLREDFMRETSRLCGLSTLVIGAVLVFWAGTAAAADVPKFEVDPFWPKPLPHNWALGQVGGVAVDERDHIWIIHRPDSLTPNEKNAATNPPTAKCCVPAPPIIEFDPDGNVVQAWGGPGTAFQMPQRPHGIRVSGNFVWFGGNHRDDGFIVKATRDGKFVMQIGKHGSRKGDQDTSQLGMPADIWVDAAANEVYVADGYGNHRVIVFDSNTGAYKRHWGAYGKRPADEVVLASAEREGAAKYDPKAPPSPTFNNPVHCVKISNDGLVYVCDRRNDRVQVFRKDGTFVREWSYLKETLGSGSVWDLYLWPDREQSFFVNVDGANNEFRVVRRSDGEVVGTYGRFGHYAGQFHGVHNVTIDSRGNLFTTEVYEGKRVQKWKVTSGAPVR